MIHLEHGLTLKLVADVFRRSSFLAFDEKGAVALPVGPSDLAAGFGARWFSRLARARPGPISGPGDLISPGVF